MNKPCTTCNKIKPLTEFRKQKSTKDGYQYQCKQCAANKWDKYYDKNAERVKQKVKEWRSQLRKP